MLFRLLLLIFLVVHGIAVSAQSTGQIRYTAEAAGLLSTSAQTPFFLRTNQYAIIPNRGSLATFRLGAERNYRTSKDTTHRKTPLDWGFGVYAVANLGSYPQQPNFLLPDAYGKVRWKSVELIAGNRREVVGLGDTVLSSGFVSWSGNSLPFPKIQIHTPNFVELGFTKKLVAFRASYAHGWFIRSYVQGSYLHQKYLYIRLGKPHWPIRFYAGLNHQVQWAGKADYLIGTPIAINGNLASSFQDYLSLVIGHYPDAIQNDRFTDFDGTNRIGNHIGSYDLAIEWKGEQQHWLLYHQHLYEDASGLALQNIPDGLTGLRYLNPNPAHTTFKLHRWVVEWLSTTNQSGSTFDPTARFQGGDNYFNHSQYREGWSYQGRTIGPPFLVPYTELAPDVANLGGSFYPNNRIVVWYTGIEASFRKGPLLTTKLSYSRNFGAYNQSYPQPIHQFSALLSAQWPLQLWPATTLITTIALDRGKLFSNSLGGFISLRRQW